MEVQPFIKRTPIFFALKLLKFGRTSNKIIKEKIKASNYLRRGLELVRCCTTVLNMNVRKKPSNSLKRLIYWNRKLFVKSAMLNVRKG